MPRRPTFGDEAFPQLRRPTFGVSAVLLACSRQAIASHSPTTPPTARCYQLPVFAVSDPSATVDVLRLVMQQASLASTPGPVAVAVGSNTSTCLRSAPSPPSVPRAMPFIPVNWHGAVPNLVVPHDGLVLARDHVVPRHELESKNLHETWTVTFASETPNVPSTSAWYKVLSVPGAASGGDSWKIGVTYWSGSAAEGHRHSTQWLWIYASGLIMRPARDFFFVNRSEQDVPRRPREVRDQEHPHQEPEREPQASVHS